MYIHFTATYLYRIYGYPIYGFIRAFRMHMGCIWSVNHVPVASGTWFIYWTNQLSVYGNSCNRLKAITFQ